MMRWKKNHWKDFSVKFYDFFRALIKRAAIKGYIIYRRNPTILRSKG